MDTNVWTPSTKCSADGCPQCVEVRHTDGNYVEVRNSGNEAVVATFTVDEWNIFLDGAKKGEFDIV